MIRVQIYEDQNVKNTFVKLATIMIYFGPILSNPFSNFISYG